MNYSYDTTGNVSGWTHPAGYTLTNTCNAAMQLTQITSSLNDATHPGTLAAMTYGPLGVLSTLVDGCAGSGCTQAQETYSYNKRLQVTQIQLGNTSNPAANYTLSYNYYLPGGPTPPGCPLQAQGSGDNGNVIGYTYTDASNPSFSHTAVYIYDGLNRLACAQATGSSTYNLAFGYERYGNMSCQQNGSTQGYCGNYSFNSANNQINTSGFSYDATGNLTADGTGTGTHTYQWDGEGKLAAVDGVAEQACQSSWTDCFTFNALGQRAERYVPSNPQQFRNIEYQYDAWGQETGAAMPSFYGQFNAQLTLPGGSRVYYDWGSNQTWFYHVNALGSTTQETDYGGATVRQDVLYYPWGQSWVKTGLEYFDERFASQGEPMPENGLYPTDFRPFSPALGRWFTPDPLAGDISNPQSLNRYAYALNNPTTLTDPTGLCGETYYTYNYDSDGNLTSTTGPTYGDPCPPDLSSSYGSGFLCALVGFGCSYGNGPNYANTGRSESNSGGSGGSGTGTSAAPGPTSPCGSIAGKGGTIPVISSNQQVRFEFNAQGNLVGLGILLNGGDTAVTRLGYSIPSQTFFGARLSGPNELTIGFNKAVQTPSSYGVSAYIQSATFSGGSGSFTNVNGAVAILSVPWGSTSASSSPLLNKLNATPAAVNAAGGLLSAFQSLSNNASCSTLFGGG